MSKGPDTLSLCSIAAYKAGMSYGKFMAMGGFSKVAEQAVELEQEFPTRICQNCGKVFSMERRSYLSKYCSQECYQRAGSKRALERYHEKKEAENVKG